MTEANSITLVQLLVMDFIKFHINCNGLRTNLIFRFSANEDIGAGAFPFLSLLNHSCNPNVVRHSVG